MVALEGSLRTSNQMATEDAAAFQAELQQTQRRWTAAHEMSEAFAANLYETCAQARGMIQWHQLCVISASTSSRSG